MLMLAGCSSDEIGDASDLVGYWKVIGTEQVEDPSSQGGLCFTKNGEIIEWGMNSKYWQERHTGKWWMSMKALCVEFILELRNFQKTILSFVIGEALLVHRVRKAVMWNIRK